VKSWFERLCFTPATRRSLVIARVIVALYSLWLVLSRPAIAGVSDFPAAMLPLRHRTFLIRFGILLLPPPVEHLLYWLMPILLIVVLFGWYVRATAIASSLLLYHFAPLEEIVSGTLPSHGHGGFAFPVLALLVIAFADWKERAATSPEYRWPVVMLQTLVALQYFLGGLSKIRFAGFTWYSGHNIAATLDELVTLTGAPWGHWAALHPSLCWAIAIATFALEFLFPLAVVWPRTRWVIIPAALVAALLRAQLYGLYNLGTPLLLLFVL